MRFHKLLNKTSGDAKSLLIFIICVLANIAFGLNILATNTAAQGNIAGKMDRPLRYRPIGRDFVIENGKEFFNRPLYGGNTAFRIDAGDKPEFSFYMPGRGGNVRIGIKSSKGAKWLIDADRIVSRYRAGSMVYEIRDALFGGGTLVLTALPTHLTEGLLIKVELRNTNETVELVTAFGGSDGDRGRRNGDIRGEAVPVTEFFQLKPEYCKDSKFAIQSNSFTQVGKGGKIAGIAPLSTVFYVADANNWNKVENLSASPDSPTPIVVGKTRLSRQTPLYFNFQKDSAKTTAEELPALFERSEEYRRSIAEKVTVETPDAYVNAAVSALNIAADGIWDEQQSAYMHGAVAWRLRLLGWRGPYAGDALGWHDRLRRHLEFWAGRQNVKPISPGPVKPDPAFNFARNPEELHTNGDISNTHYDMNIVYIDAVFRHLLWTGDVEFAKKLWPVIKRHLAWERRLFRREYGPEKLPLYEAYVCIWASDDLQYGGSGVTHSTAYNYYHQKSAARIARLIGEDPAPYELEADLIQKAMRRNLWLTDQGWYGEYKDLFGLQKVHPSAALWTYYHAVDSETMSPSEAWQMSQYVDTSIPQIPIPNTSSDTGNYFTHSTTNWMPYTWSTNNVVLAESTHTALGHWQSGRDETAFRLFKGALLDSMYMGVCPGNVGMSTDFDAARRESFRDFADGAGTTSRALIEGLFGIRPDLLAGELKIGPAFPKVWNSAAINHPDLKFSFKRVGKTDSYQIDPKFSKPISLRLKVTAQRDRISKVTVNGKSVEWKAVEDSVGQPRIEILAPAAANFKVLIEWTGERIIEPAVPQVVPENGKVNVDFGTARILEISDPQSALSRVSQTSRSLSADAAGKRGHRSVFAKVKQGDLTWQQPVMFEIRAPFEVIPSENQIGENLNFKVRNNTSVVFNRPINASIKGKKFSLELKLPAFGLSQEISINGKKHAAGSNLIELDLGEGTNVKGVVTNWKIKPDTAAEFEHVDLAKVFNDQVGNIFKNEYLSPRSPFVSLAIPKNGIGSWVKFAEQVEIDDAGLRKAADKNGGRIGLPNGVELKTVGMAGGRNIAFTSQWDNFPQEITVPLNGRASHIYLLMAGSTNQMQSRFDNGEIVVTYEDGSTEQLKLENPTTWWAIDQDYMIDDYAFRRPEAVPPRVDLQTGTVRIVDLMDFKGKGKKVKGGAATVLDLPLRSDKPLKSLTLRTLANEVVIGLMSATLKRN